MWRNNHTFSPDHLVQNLPWGRESVNPPTEICRSCRDQPDFSWEQRKLPCSDFKSLCLMLLTSPFLSPPHLPLILSQVLFGWLIYPLLFLYHQNAISYNEQLLFYPSTLCVKTDNFSFFSFHKSCGTDARWCSPQCRDSSESLWFFWASSRVCKCKNERWHLLGGAHLNEICHALPLHLEIGRGLNFLDFSFLSVYILLSHNLLFLFLS